MKTATVLGHKYGHPAGLRVFDNAFTALQGGETVDTVHPFNGALVKLPPGLDLPDEATFAQWEAEYDAEQDLIAKKAAALIAIEAQAKETALTAALADKDSPKAVKDYAAAMGKK